MKKDFGLISTDKFKPEKENKWGKISTNSLSQNTSKPSEVEGINKEENFVSDEQFEKDIERSQARTLSRIVETALGAPGDIASFFAGLFGKEQKILPKSSDIRSLTEKASQGYLSPKTEFEKKIDELSSDITSMALPGTGKYNIIRNIGIPVVGNLVKEGIKYSGAGEKAQAYGKVGTMVVLDLLSRRSGGVKEYIEQLWGEAEASVPKGVSINAVNLEKGLNDLEKSLTAGGKKPSTVKSLEKLTEIKEEIKKGKIPLDRLIPFRKSINEVIDEIGGFSSEVPFKYKPAAKYHLNEVKNEVIKSVEEYSKKFNPEMAKKWKNANEASAAYFQSNRIANFLHKKIPYIPKSKAVQALFSYSPGVAVVGLSKFTPVGAAGAATGLTAYQAFKVLERVRRSPVLRKYYQNVLKEASAENIPGATRNLKALDQDLSEGGQ